MRNPLGLIQVSHDVYSLFEADKLGAKSVAIPALGGAGVGTFPKEEITKGLINACVEYSKDTNTKTIETIRFVSSDLALVSTLNLTIFDFLSKQCRLSTCKTS